jgi:hypothetical protein
MQRPRVQVPPVPPSHASVAQRGERLILNQSGLSSNLSRGMFVSTGCGVMFASKSWELVVTVQFCPPRPINKASLVQRLEDAALPTLRCGFDSRTMLQLFFSRAVSLMEKRHASNVTDTGSSPVPPSSLFPAREWCNAVTLRSSKPASRVRSPSLVPTLNPHASVAKRQRRQSAKLFMRGFESRRVLLPLNRRAPSTGTAIHKERR